MGCPPRNLSPCRAAWSLIVRPPAGGRSFQSLTISYIVLDSSLRAKICGRPSDLRSERRPILRRDPFFANDIGKKYIVDILMFRIVGSPHGTATVRTAPQGKNRPHHLPRDHAGAPGNGDEGEKIHFFCRGEITHRRHNVSSLR